MKKVIKCSISVKIALKLDKIENNLLSKLNVAEIYMNSLPDSFEDNPKISKAINKYSDLKNAYNTAREKTQKAVNNISQLEFDSYKIAYNSFIKWGE